MHDIEQCTASLQVEILPQRAPSVLAIKFANELSSLLVVFDLETNMGGTAGQSGSCESLFESTRYARGATIDLAVEYKVSS